MMDLWLMDGGLGAPVRASGGCEDKVCATTRGG